MTAGKKPVENRDLVEEILKLLQERDLCKVTTEFEWVKGHASNEGNIEADKLAVLGAQEGREKGFEMLLGLENGVDQEVEEV